VGNYERGSRQPDLETAKKLSNFFGVSVDFLLGNTNERNSTETAKYSSLTKSQKRMIETYERLSASDDPNAQRIKDTIDRLLGISGQEDDK
jgi:transcriptional regulator with XRE-family HTH domain